MLKNALKEVMTPARGISNAKLESVPLELVISIVDPNTVRPWALLPKPTKAGSPASPPAIVVKETGSPVGPAGPCGSTSPLGPSQPGSPFGPWGPWVPVHPWVLQNHSRSTKADKDSDNSHTNYFDS